MDCFHYLNAPMRSSIPEFQRKQTVTDMLMLFLKLALPIDVIMKLDGTIKVGCRMKQKKTENVGYKGEDSKMLLI